jgi:cell division protein FtsZ
MGGGTGTGASPIIANIAHEAGVLTVAVVTKPFGFEGRVRMQQAEEGLNNLLGKVDALLVIPNEKLKTLSDQKITMKNAFHIADDVLCNSVVSLANLIKNIGFINLDFADVTTTMKDAGYTHVGFGHASGKAKAEEAARQAVISQLMDTSINGANRVLVQITCSSEIELEEIDTAMELIHEGAHPDANIIFGTDYDDNLDDEIFLTVIATSFSDKPNVPSFFDQPKYNQPKYDSKPAPERQDRQEKQEKHTADAPQAPEPKPSPVDSSLFENPVFPAPPVSRQPNEDEQIDSILEIFKSR